MPVGGGGQAAGGMPPGWMAIAEITRRIDEDRHAWPVGRTRLQKLAYFATVAGVPTGLEFVEGSYGPFAQDLTKLLSRLVNNGVLTEERPGRMLAVRPGQPLTTPSLAIGRRSSRTRRPSSASSICWPGLTANAPRSPRACTSRLRA
jgi:hypothetical protein